MFENIPQYSMLGVIVGFVQIVVVPLLMFIARTVTRTYKQNKLQNLKHEALVYSIQENLSNNGFSDDYYERLNQLMKEHNFIYRDKK